MTAPGPVMTQRGGYQPLTAALMAPDISGALQ